MGTSASTPSPVPTAPKSSAEVPLATEDAAVAEAAVAPTAKTTTTTTTSNSPLEHDPKATVGMPGWVTDPATGLTAAQVEASRAQFGPNEIPHHSTPTYVLFVRQFIGFLPFLVELAAIISISLQDYPDFAIVVAMLLVNGVLGFREEYHAKQSLEELSKSAESESTVLRDGQAQQVPSSDLVPGDLVLLVAGTTVAADSIWLKGDPLSVDTSAITGEPLPHKIPSEQYGNLVLAGCTILEGECYTQVLKTGVETEVGKAQADIMSDKQVRVVSVFQKKSMLVVQAVVVFALAFALAVLLVQGLVYNGFDSSVAETVLDAVSILIASIPIALPLVVQVNMALGASYLAKTHGAIVTSVPALQDIASMSILCSDKTGTLTTAKMSIISDYTFAGPGYTEAEVLLYAYLGSNPDKKDDPIDRAIVAAFEESKAAKDLLSASNYKQESMTGFNPKVKRTLAFCTLDGVGDDGRETVTIAKGLPAKIMDTSAGGKDDADVQWKVPEADDKAFVKMLEEKNKQLSEAGYKTIAIAICKQGDAREMDSPTFHFVGLLPMLDPPRIDTARTIESLHNANISVKMITGDHVQVGRETARLIGLGTNIQPGEAIRSTENAQTKKQLIWDADGFAAVLPSDKREVVLTLRNDFKVVTGMTGDGVNDAAALSAAQVGIAVNGATDAAKNAADLILTRDGLSPIYGAVIESRRIFARIKSYIVYRVAASVELVLTLSILVFGWGCAVDSLLVIILALLNDISMIPVAYDNAKATAKPQLPRAMPLTIMAIFFGVVQTGLALVLLAAIAPDTDVGRDDFDLDVCDKQTRGLVWMHLVLSTEFMIFSVRAPSFFFKSPPSILLLASVLLTCVAGTLISALAFDVEGASVGYVWLWNICALVFIDFIKVFFQEFIGQSPGDIIESDDIVAEVKERTDAEKFVNKQIRYQEHTCARLNDDEVSPKVEVVEMGSGMRRRFKQLSDPTIMDGFVRGRQSVAAHMAPVPE